MGTVLRHHNLRPVQRLPPICGIVCLAGAAAMLDGSTSMWLGTCSLLRLSQVQEFFQGQIYLDLLGIPVSQLAAAVVLLSVGTVASYCMGLCCFCRRPKGSAQRKRYRPQQRTPHAFAWYEGYKLLIASGGGLLLALLLTAALAMTCVGGGAQALYEQRYRAYSEVLAGVPTAEKAAFLADESQRFAALQEKLAAAYQQYGKSADTNPAVRQLATELEAQEAFEQARCQYEALAPGQSYLYQTPHRTLFGADGRRMAYVQMVLYLSIAYINNCGLESIWDYTSHSAGAAGTGYINDYTGNLVWVYNGLGFSGNRMPVAINHVYNANDKANNDFGMGYGWRSNYNQLVYQWSTDSSYYVWEDEDATRHYFKYKSSGTYEDETNPTLTLTTTGSGTTKYCITDKNGNKSYFDTNGRLTKINNNQASVSSITITYSSGKQIASITDGAGRKYQFNYSGAMLSSISFLGTGTSSLATESYTYSGNELTGISSTLLSSASFSYTSNHLLSQAEDAGGYRLAYLYNTTSSTKPNRVIQISEHDGNTDGDVLCIYYAHKQTIFTDSNNNQEVKQFNNYGSTVSIQDGQGKAQFYKYKSNNDVTKASQLALSSKLQNTVANWVRNSSFEQTGFWTAGSGNASTGSWSYTSTGYIGSKSLAISRTSSSGTIRVDSTQAAYCPANSSYTLSAYVKTTGMSGGGLGAQLVLMSSGNVIASSAPITTNTDWTRVEVTYTNTTGSDISDLTAGMRNGTSGTAYFDCVQLEASVNASRYNLVDNGDFSYNSSLGWNKNSACTSADGSSSNYYRAPALNDSCLKLVGAAEKDKQVSQTITVSGSEGDVFSVAGWALGDSAPIANDSNRRFAISAKFNYTNGTSDATLIAFNPNAIGFVNWQYVADRIVAKKAYNSITISLLYSYNVNEVYFDGIQLFKEEFGHSYVYDSSGTQVVTYTYDAWGNPLTTTGSMAGTLGKLNPFRYRGYVYDIQLAKSNKKGIPMDDAETLVKWAQEYNLPGNPRIDLGHPGRGVISQAPRAHIGSVNHIPIFKVLRG